MRTLAATLCTLEPQVAAHAAEMFGVLSDPAIYEFENEPPASEAGLRERFSRLETRQSADGTQQWLNWVIRLPGGELAGYAQATLVQHHTAYVAYELASRHWRRGIGSCAVLAMLEELVSVYEVNTFVAVLKANNFRSLALLSKLGFAPGNFEQSARFGASEDERVMVKAANRAMNAEPSESGLRQLDTLLASRSGDWWSSFYQNRAKPCPFFGTSPDESLAQWVQAGLLRPGRAIDLGCGNGRNAIYLARHGFAVEAVDYAPAAIAWAQDRAAEAGVAVSLSCRNVFELNLAASSYDLVYDSGCFHHIAPHRRDRYVELVTNALAPGGWFGLTCFRPEGGSGYSDEEVYERGSLGGGLGYTEDRLMGIWSGRLRVHSMRQMGKPDAESGLFGENFLWSLLAQKR